MGLDAVLLRALADTLGADHLVAGSDWPIVSTGPIAGRLFAALDRAGFTDDESAKIASRTVLKLLKAQA
jgi:predicted TIM-barrel fold metal-dependent hydrolase